MARKPSDRTIIIALALAAVIELTALLAHMDIIQFKIESSADGIQAGSITRSVNQIRRRGINSLVWENSQTEDPVFFHDSILTLKGSTAALKLENSTEINLSENTLITIEPPHERDSGKINLRFQRGSLQARNPYKSSTIRTDEWTVQLAQGSEVELREVGEKGVEVHLKNGQAQVQSQSGSSQIGINEIVRLNPDEGLKKLRLDPKIAWKNPPSRRIYVHNEKASVPIQWDGEAEQISVQTLGLAERTIPIRDPRAEHVALIDLSPGHHRLYLRNHETSSVQQDVEVWPAPIVHLVSPLPRDRVTVDDKVVFLWQKQKEIKSYQIHFRGKDSTENQTAEDNSLIRTFSKEDDVEWYVEAIDSQGFHIPALYKHPVFIRQNPFAPPKINAPKLRAPAEEVRKGAWLWDLIVTRAVAKEEAIEAVFSWEGVAGADQYIIEIAATEDFRQPLVIQTVKKSEFKWRKFEKKSYFWRVAAGNSVGRMGLFSAPAKIDLATMPLDMSGESVVLRKVEPAKAKAKTTPTPAVAVAPSPQPPIAVAARPEPTPRPTPEPQAEPEISREWYNAFVLRPQYSSLSVAGGDSSKATLVGAGLQSMAIEKTWIGTRVSRWMAEVDITNYGFTPTSARDYPYQGDLRWLEIKATTVGYGRSLKWAYGGTVQNLLRLERASLESVSAQTAIWFGPTIRRVYAYHSSEIASQYSLIFSTLGQGLDLKTEWRLRPWGRFVTGLGLETEYIIRPVGSSLMLKGFMSLGFSF